MSEQVFNHHSVVAVETKNLYGSLANEFTSYLDRAGAYSWHPTRLSISPETLRLLARKEIIRRGD